MMNKSPLGAFCTDIIGSTQRIENFQGVALEHHKKYLQATGRYFVKNIPQHERQNYRRGDLWVPGDALWGVFYPELNISYAESITTSMWRVISSVAYGLTEATSFAKQNKLEPLDIRGVFLAGRVIRETIFGKHKLYGGTALNACGRLEKKVKDNNIIVGFVMPPDETSEEPLFDSYARSPIINASKFSQYLRERSQPRNSGCDIGLDLVNDSANGRRLLRFRGWPHRQDLRGLGKCSIFTTTIVLKQKKEKGFEIMPESLGDWDREEVTVPVNENKLCWGLHELLDKSETKSFEFMKDIYDNNKLKISVPDRADSPFELSFTGERCRPRISLKGEPKEKVDLNHSCCILPTHQDRASGYLATLIQAYTRNNNKMLCFSLGPERLFNKYDDYKDFLDSATPCIEFKFCKE